MSLTPSQLSLLNEQEGIFSKYSEDGKALIEAGLVDSKAISFGRFHWKINQKGLGFLKEA